MKKFIPILLFIVSCQKQKVERIYVTPEKVSTALLNKYIDYELAVERKSLFGIPDTVKTTMGEFNAMIDNFLANERNNLRREAIFHTLDISDDPCYDDDGNIIICPSVTVGAEDDNSVSCTGTFQDYNTSNTILFTATLNGQGTDIVSSAFAFGGISAAWTTVGTIQETLYDGAISYKQYYQETYPIVGTGLTETQLYLMYGNISGGKCTVHGMQVPKPIEN